MALKEVARFYDLGEAQAAAGLLRSGGFPVFVDRELAGSALAMTGYAAGSYTVWVPASEADVAKNLIDEVRASEPPERTAARPPTGLPATALTAALLILVGPSIAFMVPATLRRPALWRWIGGAVLTAIALCMVWGWRS